MANIIESIINSFTTVEPEDHVAAGDPLKKWYAKESNFEVVDKGMLELDKLKRFLICGKSMSQCGIEDGDYVYAEVAKQDDLKKDDFLIIEVDNDPYFVKATFKNKIRRFLTKVEKDDDIEKIINKLESIGHLAIYLEENVSKLEDKFKKARKMYGNDEELSLSITYKDSQLNYSFHKTSMVKYKVKYIVSIQSQSLKSAEEIASF